MGWQWHDGWHNEWDKYIMLLLAVRLVFPIARKGCTWYLQSWRFNGVLFAKPTILCAWPWQPFSRTSATCFAFNWKCASQKISNLTETCQCRFSLRWWIHLYALFQILLFTLRFGTQGLGWKMFDWKSTCRFSEYLDKLFASSHFKAVRTGKLGTHSLRKGPSTYASRFGFLRNWIFLCGCWWSNKKQVDICIDVDMPYPDAKVASVLCGPWGLCKYTMRDRVEVTDDFFLFNCSLMCQSIWERGGHRFGLFASLGCHQSWSTCQWTGDIPHPLWSLSYNQGCMV